MLTSSPADLARRDTQLYQRHLANAGGSPLATNGEGGNIQRFVEGLYSVAGLSGVRELWFCRSAQNAGSETTLYGFRNVDHGTLTGSTWTANAIESTAGQYINFGTIGSLTAPCSLLAVALNNPGNVACFTRSNTDGGPMSQVEGVHFNSGGGGNYPTLIAVKQNVSSLTTALTPFPTYPNFFFTGFDRAGGCGGYIGRFVSDSNAYSAEYSFSHYGNGRTLLAGEATGVNTSATSFLAVIQRKLTDPEFQLLTGLYKVSAGHSLNLPE